MKITKFLMLLGLMLLPVWVMAQVSSHLTMNEALEISSKQNVVVQTSELEHRIAKSDYRQTDAIFLPQVSLGYNAMVTNNPLNAFGFLLQQSGVQPQNFDPAQLNHPGATRNYSASVEVQMPLLNVDMIYARKGARLQEETYKYKAQHTKNYIRFEVQKAYSQLQFAYQSRDILITTLKDVEDIHQSVTNFYQQGLVQKSDVLNAEVQVNTIKTALAKAETAILTASEGLGILLGADVGEKNTIYTTDSLIQQQHKGLGDFSLFRADIRSMQKAVDASRMMAKSNAMNFLPSINAFGNYQFNDSKIFRFQEDSYLMGISLNWKLFTGNSNRSKYRSASLQRDKMQKELNLYIDKSRMEVNKTHRDLLVLQTEIDRQQLSVMQAQEALRIMSDRFAEGLVSTTDLLMSQAQYSQQQLMLAQAVMSYNVAFYYQDFLTTVN